MLMYNEWVVITIKKTWPCSLQQLTPENFPTSVEDAASLSPKYGSTNMMLLSYKILPPKKPDKAKVALTHRASKNAQCQVIPFCLRGAESQ